MDLDADHIWCIAHRLHLVVTNALALWPKKKRKNPVDGPNQGKKINLDAFKYTIIPIRIGQQLNDCHHLLCHIFVEEENNLF